MQELKSGDPIPQSGVDMGATIAWYTINKNIFSDCIPLGTDSLPFPVTDIQHSALNQEEIAAIVNLFPPQAIARSILQNNGSIIGKPTRYFAQDATPEKITTTSEISNALSPTAIIPSYTDNDRWKETKKPTSDIWLFEIPNHIDPEVRRIIHAEGLVHELAHTLVTQILYSEEYKLKLPSGKIVDGYDYLINFASAAEKHPPISHYSSFYRKDGEEFKALPAIDEEIVETIAAHLLGFVFCQDEERRLDPLADRREIQSLIDDFLHVELVE